MINPKKKILNSDNKIFLIIFTIAIWTFLFTSDAHRYTFDEDVNYQQTKRFIFQEHNPLYIDGKTRALFEFPDYYPYISTPLCKMELLCSPGTIGQASLYAPFIIINHNFGIYEKDPNFLSDKDFDIPHYVWWRNSLEADHDFLEFLYGPIFSALAVGIFFKISRHLNYNRKISIFLTFLFALATTTWAYSNTSLNVVASTFLILLSLLYFFNFRKNSCKRNLIFCGLAIGYSFIVRYDSLFFAIIIAFFILYYLKHKKEKLTRIFLFIMPFSLFVGIQSLRNFLAFGSVLEFGYGKDAGFFAGHITPLHEGVFGILLSPGVGLLIFSPILLTMFFSFVDFKKKHKIEFLMFILFFLSFLIFYGTFEDWHGLLAWGARYLVPIIPFILLPLGSSLEKRKRKSFIILLLVLGTIGFFFNTIYVIQDFNIIWGDVYNYGLFHLPYLFNEPARLNIHPVVLWTFEYSQLTVLINEAFTNLQPDIFLLKVLGPQFFTLAYVAIIVPATIFLIRAFKEKTTDLNKQIS